MSECVCVSVCVDGVSELVIESVSAADAGTYQCFVSNVAGTASALMTVSVQPSDQQSSHMQNISPHGTWCSHAHTHIHTHGTCLYTHTRGTCLYTHRHTQIHTPAYTHTVYAVHVHRHTHSTCLSTHIHTCYVFTHTHTHTVRYDFHLLIM